MTARPETLPDSSAVRPATAGSPGMGSHYLRYSGSTVLVMAAGLISFPALTRLLDNTQYGILGYYETWLMIVVAIIKLGGQHAILRLYPYGGTQSQLVHFATNLVLLPMLVSMGLWLVALAGIAAASAWGGLHVSPVFWCAVVMLPLLVFNSQVEMTLRASERSGLLAVSQVSSRWLELILILGFVVAVQRSALAVYAGKIAVAVILVAFYLRWVRRHLVFSRSALDLPAYRASLRYSLPLVANEMAGAALVSIDRVMLKGILDDYSAVGIYTIGCALAVQIWMIMNQPLWGAFNPVANRTHETEGPARVRALKSRVLVPATYASIGIGAAIWLVGADLLEMLTGPTKVASAPVFVWLGTMFALLPVLDVGGYGLLLQKRTMTVLILTTAAAILNIMLNLLWIPIHGVMGSVYATLVAYVLLSVGRCVLCPRELFQLPDSRTLVVAGVAASLFALVVHVTGLFGLDVPWMRVAAGGGLWAGCYAVPALLLDARLRQLVFHWRTTRVV